MSDPKTKRTFEQETLILPSLRLEPQNPNPAADRRASRYDDLALPERQKVVNKLIDHLKGL
ncbi:hypothetical protein LARV_02040 [Longilinea arvoryzae]|uniref:Uncharacterized protein n=1 Tax=Longilinea arvoryzae TaxID=360412 RepID=A0A0S7BJB3_9CHLR|nr:hypothetical protein [Longilinea arvoryzae]GAP14274.1 hypothetical protein LARV_02040 [Longilinea arvoryzae]